MTVQDVFEKYRILPILQLHQLRVAAVGKTICDHFDQALDMQSVMLACLFHDMANIIKSELGVFPGALEPQGREYWEQVKKEFIEQYGESEHTAALAIAREIGLPGTAVRLIGGIGFSQLEETRDRGSFELKIVEYSDCRVSPAGVTSMTQRLADAKARYADTFSIMPEAPGRYNELLRAAHDIEHEIFAHTDIQPDELTEAVLRPVAETFREYKIT